MIGRIREVPPAMANTAPIAPTKYPEPRARRRPPRLVKFASGNAIAAAPRTPKVCANPASASDFVILATNSEPAATVLE